LSKAATRAKAKWNKANYVPIKVSIYPEIAEAFKAACAVSGVSMTSVLSQFMTEYSEMSITQKVATAAENPVFSKKKRRKTVRAILLELEQVRDAEERAIENTPDNFRNSDSFAASEENLVLLEEAIEILEGIY